MPFEQEVNPFVEHQSCFTRLHPFVLMSDALIVAPGGIGMVLESMMTWQLLQVHHLHEVPPVFVGPMWKGLVDRASSAMLRPCFQLAIPEDMRMPLGVDGTDQAIAIVGEHHERRLATQERPLQPGTRTER